MLQNCAFGLGLDIWNNGKSPESGEGRASLYMGVRTPVLVMVHFRFREASQRTTLEEDEDAWPGSDAVALPLAGAPF